MEINVTESRLIELKQVYNPIVLISTNNEKFFICMRDGGFEFEYEGKPYRAVNGVLSEVITNQPKQSSEAESLTTVNGLSGRYNPDNDYMKVAERLFYEQNSYTPKLDVPSIVYEYAERWHKEFRDDTTWVGTFYDWCIEYKQPKKKDHSNDEDKVGSGN